jgi:DNA (cytosine-5)-methyltransferase 1
MNNLLKIHLGPSQFLLSAESLNPKLKKQVALIRTSIQDKCNFSELLKSNGLSYDDLSYLSYLSYLSFDKPLFKKAKIPNLSDFSEKQTEIPMVSFFSGAGGLDLGFEALGFSHKLLVEKIQLFSDTLKLNKPDWNVYTGDVSNKEVMTSVIESHIGTTKPFEGLFVGGPPCQPFSIASNQRFSKSGENFKRIGFSHAINGNLLFDYIELIKHFKPKVFLIENVPGLGEVDGGEQLKLAYSDLEKSGYKVNAPLIVKAAYHNVPQQRVRLFIIGSRTQKDLLPLTSTVVPLACGSLFEKTLNATDNHVTREHSAESVLRYMQLAYGKRDQLGRVDRLDPSKPSKTIIAGGTNGGGRSHLHPYIPRTLSVRESARLQTFPDNYIFTGSVARQFTQVGNAVPPVLAAQLAKIIKDSFFK